MTTIKKLRNKRKKTLFSFQMINCGTDSRSATVDTDPTSPSSLTTTHLLA